MATEKGYLNCKKLSTAINRAKAMLIKKADAKGLYENFGEDEYREMKDKFIDTGDYSIEMNDNREALHQFANWSGNYTTFRGR